MVAKVVSPGAEMMARFVPYGTCLLLRVMDKKNTDGGLILPDAVTDGKLTALCRVLAVGPNAKVYRVGDTVVMHRANPVIRRVEFGYGDDEKGMVVEEENVLGKLADAVE